MSTKTTFKRIALVAVAALGLGVLSVAPSSAAAGTITLTVVNGTAGQTGAKSDSTTAAYITVSSLLDAGSSDSISITFIPTGTLPTGADVWPVLKLMDSTTASTGVVTYTNEETSANPTKWAVGDSVTAGNAYSMTAASGSPQVVAAKFALQLESVTSTARVAGTYSYLAIAKGYTGGSVDNTKTITAAVSIVVAQTAAEAAAEDEEPSAAYSSAYLGLGATADASVTADATSINFVATASTTTKAAKLAIVLNNASDIPDIAIDTVTVTVTGPGLVYSGTAYTKYVKIIGTASDILPIYADGTAGTSTISVSYETTGQTFTKTMTFYSAAAKAMTAANFQPVLAVGPNVGAVAVVATDVNGNPWTGTAYIVAATAADALIAGSSTPVECAAWNSTTGILCPVSVSALGTANLKVIDASTVALATATSNTVSVTATKQIAASVRIAFDKATYAPNEKALITVTPLDADGKTMQGKDWSNLLTSTGITTSTAFGTGGDVANIVDYASLTTSAYSSASSNLIAGSKTYVVYMPFASGDITISAKGGAGVLAAGQVAITATASVVNASVDAATDAANEATDAANAATDAALAAADAADAATAAAQDASDAVAALSTQVAALMASLKAQIKSLTNLVIKIQKKVKA